LWLVGLLKNIPKGTNLACVIVQHLHPTATSNLAEILSRKTKMQVVEVTDGVLVSPGVVYVIPSGTTMVIEDGDDHLTLSPRKKIGINLAIDTFFLSLAKHKKHNSVGVLLSGAGSDGTLGMKAIREAGGITFAQNDTSEFSSMPQSAILAGVTDYVLSPKAIAAKLIEIAKASSPRNFEADNEHKSKHVSTAEENDLRKILSLLLNASDVDFTYYKQGTLKRRIMRRMLINKQKSFHHYAQYLKKNPKEAELLYQDVLIHVTNFFRDEQVFDFLKKHILPELFKKKPQSIRMWVPGCSTGEEVFSFAIFIAEYMERQDIHIPIQIFGTDISEEALSIARRGVYRTGGVEGRVPPPLLRKYFEKTERGYEVAKGIRSMCIFSRHNIIADIPFSRMDIVSCRNVLIYLDSILQQKAFPIFHFALNPKGYLILGTAETAASFQDLFVMVNKDHKIYMKKSAASRPGLDFSRPNPAMKKATRAPEKSPISIEKEADSIVLSRHAPAGVIINNDLAIIQFRGDVSPYLKPVPGRAALDLIKMAHKGLLPRILEMLTKARKSNATVKSILLRMGVAIEIVPLSGHTASPEKHFLVLFEPIDPKKTKKDTTNLPKNKNRTHDEHREIEEELNSTISQLQVLVETRDVANEDLKSAHEELMSANEELQSTNEELETTKEELQSANEELITLNAELQNRNVSLKKGDEVHKKVIAQLQHNMEELGRKDEFISILGHELRNPLAPILYSLELAKLHGIEDPELRQIFEVVERQSNLMNEIIKSLLDAARAMGGKIQIRTERTDFCTVVRHAVETAAPLISLAKHTLSTNLPSHPITMRLDPLRMEQVIVNLLNNASKYTQPGGHITLTVNEYKDKVLLSVRDTGIGISEDMLPKIFNLFSQANQPISNFKGGLGVGLMLARTLAELHGGSLTAKSDGFGTGSEFILELPLKKDTESNDSELKDTDLKNFKPQKRRIMIVDDNSALADSFAKLLRELSQEVRVHYDGASALLAVPTYTPDLVFIDVAMPTMDGYQLAKALRKERSLAKAKLIALTGFGEEYKKKSAKVGFHEHLTKPIDIAELKRLLLEPLV
jgi:two-component system CheB/CheR fusion protein